MKLLCLIVACTLSGSPIQLARADNPIPERFTAIVNRNAFRLSPPKPLPIEAPPQINRSKVYFHGITTILGRVQALLAIQPQPVLPGQLPTSCVLAQGERHFEVVVLEINQERGTVRLSNLGLEYVLEFKGD